MRFHSAVWFGSTTLTDKLAEERVTSAGEEEHVRNSGSLGVFLFEFGSKQMQNCLTMVENSWQSREWIRNQRTESGSFSTSFALSHHCLVDSASNYVSERFLVFGIGEDRPGRPKVEDRVGPSGPKVQCDLSLDRPVKAAPTYQWLNLGEQGIF
ncbi:hypothetical protein FNV43_RR07358 [Rhamnella rubrinervis]|uniref:Uncharacterized protein n=1 Tax=Rhamnella rubrinervis TaxID=2594499 RepID=A0A8K0HFP6_9ROSA|nr:hypothetical protein FNV43_RR07358 [Rhamnella rubrinervis]